MAARLSVRVARGAARSKEMGPQIGVEVADTALAEALVAHLQQRLDAAIQSVEIPEIRVVSDTDLGAVAGALVLVDVGTRSAEALRDHVLAIASAGAAGIQIVWSGRPRRSEAAVFSVLEAWRGSRQRCPLMLAPDNTPLPWLLRAIGRAALNPE